MTQRFCKACICLLAGILILTCGLQICYAAEDAEPEDAETTTKCIIMLPATPVDIYVPEPSPGPNPPEETDPPAPGTDEPDAPDQPGKDDPSPAPDTPNDNTKNPVKPVQDNSSAPDVQNGTITGTAPATGDDGDLMGYGITCIATAVLLYGITRRGEANEKA